MKLVLAFAALWIAGTLGGVAQSVSVELFFDQQYFLPNEALVVKVRVTNYSGQTLYLGKDDDWLSFSIEGRKDHIVSRLAPVAAAGEYTLESSRTGTKAVDLAPHFDLSRPGHYKVTASVKIPQWQQVVQSEPKGFDIITGSKLWEQEFGIPQSERPATERPEMRRYTLVQMSQQKQIMLYFRLSDATDTKVFRIYPIGPMVSFSKPDPQLDKFSNLHILYQISAKTFSYSVINPDGLLIARETYDYAETRPKLRADEIGRITVAGGVRRITSSDVPPPVTSTTPLDAGAPKP